MRMTGERLASLLEGIAQRVRENDSMEGGIEWSWSDVPGEYVVIGTARVGNSEGQGGVWVFSRIEGEQLLHEIAESEGS